MFGLLIATYRKCAVRVAYVWRQLCCSIKSTVLLVADTYRFNWVQLRCQLLPPLIAASVGTALAGSADHKAALKA
jgi:hypothetical protein